MSDEIKIITDEFVKFNTEQQPKQEQRPQVPIFNLVPETDPILQQVMPEFDFENPPMNPNALASSLVETCMKHKGYGLSANQCGLPYRVFVMGTGDEYVAFFNPEVVLETHEQVHMQEGCLSFPMLALGITRPKEICVRYQDWTGEWKQAQYTGMSARCFLHELDHMNGIVYTKRVKPLALQQGMKKRDKLKKMMKKIDNGNSNRIR